MSQIVVFENLSLDGVMQAPGGADEDIRGDFKHGGWATSFGAMQSQEAREGLSSFGALLLGRITYEDFYGFWPKQGNNPFTEMLNNMSKYVVSTSLSDPLAWGNTTLINNNLAKTLTDLKAQQEGDIVVMGSGVLIQSLMQYNLIDRYVLLIHPLVLGSGSKLFPDGGISAKLNLISAKATPNGVIVATYQPDKS